MRSPPVYVVVRTSGDGWGHNSYEHVAWYFDEHDADEHARKLKEAAASDYVGFNVEKIPAADPMSDPEKWW